MKKRVPTEKEIARKHGVSVNYVVRQAEVGSTVEREHVTTHEEAYGIALQHIAEFPDYYKHLLNMEKQLKKEWEKKKPIKENHIAVAMGKELDDEGSMIMSQLDTMQDAIDRLKSKVKNPDMQLPGWVQSKITLACDYIDTVADYMTSKNEAVSFEIDSRRPKKIATMTKQDAERHSPEAAELHKKAREKVSLPTTKKESVEIEEGMTLKDFKKKRSAVKQKEKRAADKLGPNRRAGIHADKASPERAARHRANVDPDFEGNDERNYPGGKLRPNKVRKAKALGELGEMKTFAELKQELEESAWTRKEGQNKSGGLNEKGRKSYERENPGSDLKAPSKKVGNPRRASFCARMKGMKSKLTSAKTAKDPDSRINKSLRAWNC